MPGEEVWEAVKHGVGRIHLDIGIRLAMTAAIRKSFAEASACSTAFVRVRECSKVKAIELPERVALSQERLAGLVVCQVAGQHVGWRQREGRSYVTAFIGAAIIPS